MPRILIILVSIIIVLLGITNIAGWFFNRKFIQDVKRHAQNSSSFVSELLTEKDIRHLPPPVQKYLRYTQVIGKPKIRNFHIKMEGKMRQKDKSWFTFNTRQYNYVNDPGRYFFMYASLKGLPVNAYHAYGNENALMLIKAFSLIPIVHVKGKDLFRAETVTFFNDLCLFAPAALIDPRIEWGTYDDTSAVALFIQEKVRIQATLIFDEEGKLKNFVSDDRMDISDSKQYRFSTPVKDYHDFNGYQLPSYGEAIWHYPDGPFTYGQFKIRDVEYNINDLNQ